MNCTASQSQARSKTNFIDYEPPALDHAIHLIHRVCCLAGSFDLIEDFHDQALCAAVDRHDSAVLFDRLMHDFSFQGISDQIALNYMARHGQATWHAVKRNLTGRPPCQKLKTYWAFHVVDPKRGPLAPFGVPGGQSSPNRQMALLRT